MRANFYNYEKILMDIGNKEIPEGFLYPTRTEAIAVIAKRIKELGTGVISDVDDTLFLATAPLLILLENKSGVNGRAISPQTFVNQGGSFENSPHLIAAASERGDDINSLIAELFSSPYTYVLMPAILGALKLKNSLNSLQMPFAGYITARPPLTSHITAATLSYYGFNPAPIIHIEPPADKNYQRISKLNALSEILSLVADYLKKPLIFLDDHPFTITEIKNNISGDLCLPILVRGLRSRAAGEQGFTYKQIIELINQTYAN